MECPNSKSHICSLYKNVRNNNGKWLEIFRCETCKTYYIASELYPDGAKFSTLDKKGRKIIVTNIHTEYIKKKLTIGDKIAKSKEEYQKYINELPKIEVHSFLIIQDVFKCTSNNHELKNIDASLHVMNKNSDIELVYVSAGYCEQCNRYFIIRSVYEEMVLKHGEPLCYVIDEKKDYEYNSLNPLNLRDESILMRYGYSVAAEGPGDLRRKKILATLVDNKMITKSEIISYLDFFISSHEYDDKFQNAISKWEEDRSFIAEYNIGEYTQVGVYAFYH